ncbi:NUDIX domain-containing protein [Planosporangium mesophilum]|uniref:NUDIX hydrolase n=1 Tax=Planosporangium mesophilum TaxID=689768 RepID=A0A8J3TGC7_9ACTN|nr:NUDIX hydrolase [Planosporangium mesophilum]GII24642.1 NUDIX hydrolase [Planosporangium mesophilum]
MTSTEAQPSALAKPLVAAGVIFVDEHDRLLLVRPTYKEYWDIPGGYVEPGESPREAVVREVAEELGIRPPIGDLLSVDWAPHPEEGDKVLFIFDGGRLNPNVLSSVRFGDGEIAEYAFVPTADLDRFTIARLVRRLQATHAARGSGRSTYLEHGAHPEA